MPWKQGGKWRAWVRNAAGVNEKVWLGEARTREEAKRLEADLRMQARRQREGPEPVVPNRRWTGGEMLWCWVVEYRAGRGHEGSRFKTHFEGSDLAQLPVASLTA